MATTAVTTGEKRGNNNNDDNSRASSRALLKRCKRKTRRQAIPILLPGQQQELDEGVLPDNMHGMERFFAAFLRSSPSTFAMADCSRSKDAATLWADVCHRVGLETVTEEKINLAQACYRQEGFAIGLEGRKHLHHFRYRAALVLEETRHCLSEALAKWSCENKQEQLLLQQKSKLKSSRQQRHDGGSKGGASISMRLSIQFVIRRNEHGHAKVSAYNPCRWSREELQAIRLGTVFACIPCDSQWKKKQNSLKHVILGAVLKCDRDQLEEKRSFEVMWFRDVPLQVEETDWMFTPLESFLTQLRCFEAMASPGAVKFLPALLRGTPSETKDKDSAIVKPPWWSSLHPGSLPFKMSKLNDTQERAASKFLGSPSKSITVVQGPPGTGKTSLLVSVICQYLMEPFQGSSNNNLDGYIPRSGRLMVCAPTNKALSVLAARFLAATNNISSTASTKFHNFHCNAVLVGDAEKLLVDERSSSREGNEIGSHDKSNCNNMHSSLKSIFLYTWNETIHEEYSSIRDDFICQKKKNREMNGKNSNIPLSILDIFYDRVLRLEKKLANGLRGLDCISDLLKEAAKLTRVFHTMKSGKFISKKRVVKCIEEVLTSLTDTLPSQQNVNRVLLRTADVIFCTLASAGNKVFRDSKPVEDLIVDEAAAATEPELSIPFHLQPKRLLVVGDPLQLPATVMSPRAVDLKLGKSLQERLMFECNHEFIMLDVQYRMHPDISRFPSKQFYGGTIRDGENVLKDYANKEEGAQLADGKPLTFLQVDGEENKLPGGSYCNEAEANAVVKLVRQLRAQTENVQAKWHSSIRLRVITFYQAQVNLIKTKLAVHGLKNSVVVATVDSSQGCEADMVVVSFVRSPPPNQSKWASAGFLGDDRRMNVALTRARYQLILVGNMRDMARMTKSQTLQQLSKLCDESKN